jgi:hypothetical protein
MAEDVDWSLYMQQHIWTSLSLDFLKTWIKSLYFNYFLDIPIT